MALTEQQAKQNLSVLIDKFNKLSADDRKTTSEASVVRQFIDILLRDVLEWPIEDTARYRYEQVTQVGRPDMMLTPERGGTIFVEAKRFGIIKELQQARTDIRGVITPGQMALPGMAVDRTPEEQQAINYAFSNNGTWAILTNFEKLRLFNARRDWLVLSFERPIAYLDDFDLLWQLSYHNVINGSLDTLNNQRFTAEVDTDYLQFINTWRENLAQDILEHRAQNTWVTLPDGSLDLPRLRAAVQRIIDRLVIVRFAEDHLVVTPGTLRGLYELRQQNIYVDLDEMLNKLFRRFDEIHNSALFAKGIVDETAFSDEVLVALLSKLYEARYRSMPPDIMGNTYEQYLGKTLVLREGKVQTADNLETRKKQGSYYTPQVIVRYIVDNSLGRYLYGTENGQPDGKLIEGETRKTAAMIKDLRVLDSACGSGSFLIYAYQVLERFYDGEKDRLKAERQRRLDELTAQGLTDPFELQIELATYKIELERIANHQRLILETHLYGVDLDPQAAEIAVVNLMMRGMERQYADKQLPLILNQNVKVGNSLIGLRYGDPRLTDHTAQIAAIRQLRQDLIRTPHNTPDHEQVVRDLERETAALYSALNQHFTDHFTDPAAIHPFHWAVEFPEVFFDKDGAPLANPGFTVIIGNPPWEILKPDLREYYAQFDERIESKLNRPQVEARIIELDAEDPRRRTAFEASVKMTEHLSVYVRRAANYTRQGRGDLATHKLFLERMYHLLSSEGRLGYVVPSGIYTDLGTKDLREMLLNEGNIQYIYSFSNERFFFPGVHHSFKFTMIGAQKGPQTDGFWSVFRFNPRVAIKPDELLSLLANIDNLVYMKRDSVAKFSPDSLSVMEFESRETYSISERIYSNWPLLGDELEATWNIRLNREFDMTNDRALFNQVEDGYPLYAGKMIHQYDAFYAAPQYWVSLENALKHFGSKKSDKAFVDYDKPRLGFREITFATNARTLIATILPPKTCCNHKISVASPRLSTYNSNEMLYCLSVLNSLTLDFIARLKITSGMSMFHFYQLPVPRFTSGNPYFDAIVPRAARLTCTRPEFADLWQSVMGGAWDESKGATDPAERQQLRNEIDALVAHLYGLSRADFDHILGTFPLVFPDSEIGRAKRAALLAAYDVSSP